MRTHILSLLAPLTTLTLLLTSPARADSGAQIAADLELGAPMDGGTFALGGGGRFGWRFDLGPIWLQPEAAGHYVHFFGGFGCDEWCPDWQARASRALGGLRLGGAGLISGVIEPSLFGHAGYGFRSSKVHGPAFDAGFALDVKAARVFRFGIHGAYNVIVGRSDLPPYSGPVSWPATKWVTLGLHVGAGF